MKTEEQILDIATLGDVLELTAADFVGRRMSPAEFAHIVNLCGQAFWRHDGNPRRPHALLTSGKHSSGFVNCTPPLSYGNVLDIMAAEMVKEITERCSGPIHWVVGSSYAAITLSQRVAAMLGNARHGFTEKGEGKEQIWSRFVIDPGERVLRVEELMTTALTARMVTEGIRAGNPTPVDFVPFVVTLVHRSSETNVDGADIIYPFHFDIETWEAGDCPLCRQGSEAIRPKANWPQLIAV